MAEVRLIVPYGSREERMAAEEIRKKLSTAVGDVMFDPPAAVGSTNGFFSIFGPDADRLFEDIKRSLEGTQIFPGTSAVILGEGEPKEVELV